MSATRLGPIISLLILGVVAACSADAEQEPATAQKPIEPRPIATMAPVEMETPIATPSPAEATQAVETTDAGALSPEAGPSLDASVDAAPAGDCFDTVLDGVEGDVDCGHTCAQKCSTYQSCHVGPDCASGVCTAGTCAAPSCFDGHQNGLETGPDCGGTMCSKKCGENEGCKVKADCAGTLACVNGRCL